LLSIKLLLIGSGGHCRVVIDTAKRLGFDMLGIIDINYNGNKEKILGVPVIGGVSTLSELDPKEVSVNVSIGDNFIREKFFSIAKAKGFPTPSIISPTAIVSEYATINSGNFINNAAIINTGVEIGENSIINTGAIIEHEVVIGDHSHICPGVKIGGRVSIGEASFIGIGANIIDKVEVGDHAVIGAGSVIIGDVESHSKVVGVYGKKIT
jgi:sugar O-acyltransferase (sialic acid O-acetyltransferase NeuD family)